MAKIEKFSTTITEVDLSEKEIEAAIMEWIDNKYNVCAPIDYENVQFFPLEEGPYKIKVRYLYLVKSEENNNEETGDNA